MTAITLTVAEALERATAARRRGDAPEAERLYAAILDAAPGDIDALLQLSALLLEQGRPDAALAAVEALLGRLPDHPDALRNHGLALQALGRTTAARASFRRVLALAPDHAPTLHDLDSALAAEGQPGAAAIFAARALSLLPEVAALHTGLGNALKLQGRADEARACYRRALALAPDDPAAHGNLGYAGLAQQDAAAALAASRRALAIAETAALRSLFVKSLAESTSIPSTLRDIVARALAELWARPSSLASVAAYLARTDAAVRQGLALVEAKAAMTHPLLRDIAGCRILHHLMVSCPVPDIELERLLTAARTALLDLASREDPVEPPDQTILDLACALARQCFLNEYVFAVTDDETLRLDRLRGLPPTALRLAALAAYGPLHALADADRLAQGSWPAAIGAVIVQQILEPREEHRLAASIPRLTPIRDQVSRAVGRQYEENPFPPWIATAAADPPMPIGAYLRQILPAAADLPAGDGDVDVLVAGCGTGQQSVETAERFRCRSVLAIDLSLSSLAYARRKSDERGLQRIEYAQADILELGSLGRRFDLIEANGVLHHLADPFAGWRVLLGLLRPGGLMHLGFYSATARRHLDPVRAFIAERGYGSDAAGIRRFRHDLLSAGSPSLVESVVHGHDFFSMSACRDLLFHAEEHLTTLPAIAAFLRAERLTLLGFDLAPVAAAAYRSRFPGDPAMTDLDAWQVFEAENPETFVGMYQFWIRKPA